MKNKKNPAVKKIMFLVGFMLLLICAFVVSASAIISRNRIAKELDEKLYERIQKYTTAYSFTDFPLTDDEDEITEAYHMRYYIEDKYKDLANVEDLKEIYVETLSFTKPIFEEAGDVVDYDITQTVPVVVISDTSGDKYLIWENQIIYSMQGYRYMCERSLRQGDEYFVVNAENEYSYDGEMIKAANSFIEENKDEGWYKDLRFTTCTYYLCSEPSGESEIGLQYYFIDEYPYEKLDKERKAETEKVEVIYKEIFFEDGSAQMKQWRTWTLENALFALGFWIVCMVVLYFCVKAFLKEKKEKPEVTSEAAISEELAKELLLQINQSETSLGPNDYLDQMRTLIENRMPSGTKTEEISE
ncbi:MAG: hypothetical protein J6Y08_01430 [Clostridiales bacterium]|nr:hypothetical protein [Clostridiales bacterium]